MSSNLCVSALKQLSLIRRHQCISEGGQLAYFVFQRSWISPSRQLASLPAFPRGCKSQANRFSREKLQSIFGRVKELYVENHVSSRLTSLRLSTICSDAAKPDTSFACLEAKEAETKRQLPCCVCSRKFCLTMSLFTKQWWTAWKHL